MDTQNVLVANKINSQNLNQDKSKYQMYGASSSTVLPATQFHLNNKFLGAEMSFNHSFGDSGYNSNANHQATHSSTNIHSSSNSHHSTAHSKLYRICEENESVSMHTSPIPSPVATPTTASIRGMNALQLNSPKLSRSNIRSPVKRQISMANNPVETEKLSITPSKILKVMEERQEIENEYTPINSNKCSPQVLTPNRKAVQSVRFCQKDTMYDLDAFDRTPLSPIHGIKSKTNVLRNKLLHGFNTTPQKSLSTSTPKFIYENENYPNHVTKSGSPRKKRRLIKKFQSFSPVKFVNNQENICLKVINVDQAKKRLKFPSKINDGAQKLRNKLLRQNSLNKIDIFMPPQKSDSIESNSNSSRLEAIAEEVLQEDQNESKSDLKSEMITRHAPNESIFPDSFSFQENNVSIGFKHQDLIEAPIKIYDSLIDVSHTSLNNVFVTPEKCKISSKRTSSFETPPAKKMTQNISSHNQYSSFSSNSNNEPSLCDSFVDEYVGPDLSIPKINLYFDKMKERSFNDSQNISESEIKNIYSGYLNTRDSLELLTDDVQQFASYDKNPPPDFLNQLLHNPILTTPVKNASKSTPIKQNFNRAEYEKTQILHAEIPKTPSKLNKRKSLKRVSSSKISNYTKSARAGYEGIERLNIFDHLKGCELVIDKILALLNDEDLVRVALVSRSWKNILENNCDARERRYRYLKEMARVKENLKIAKVKKNKNHKATKSIRMPLVKTNFLPERKKSRESSESPPRSPSMFNENQKV